MNLATPPEAPPALEARPSTAGPSGCTIADPIPGVGEEVSVVAANAGAPALGASHPTRVGIALLVFGVLALAWGVALNGAAQAQPQPGRVNIFWVQFAQFEPLAWALHGLSAAVLWKVFRSGWRWTGPASRWTERRVLGAVAALVGALALAGTFGVFHAFPFSMDEYAASVQAEIFARGRVFAPIADAWRDTAGWLTPIVMLRDPFEHTWTSPYLPVHSAMLAAFHWLGAPWLLNPLLAAASVLALAGVARRIWPEDAAPRWVAVALLATSSQFLLTSMTGYSMPAHLALNLGWLALFLRRDRVGWALAPWLGLLAVGLHQPVVHLLFAFPFCLRLVRERRWGWAGYTLAVYALALALTQAWWEWTRPMMWSQTEGLLKLPGTMQLVIQPMNLALLLAWGALAGPVLFGLALGRWRRLPAPVQDAAWSCALTFGFYLVFASDQGHGWGYRYFHAALGCFVLVAAAGWRPLCEALGAPAARTLVAGACAWALCVGFPLRCVQAEGMVGPFAEADAALSESGAAVLLIPPSAAWYAQDLIRNAPFLDRGPARAWAVRMSEGTFQAMQRHGRVKVVTGEELARFGLPAASPAIP